MKRRSDALLGENGAVFGCASCQHQKRGMCWFDKLLPRPVVSWGHCPEKQICGPVRAWEASKRARCG